jgi:hypothetical protein
MTKPEVNFIHIQTIRSSLHDASVDGSCYDLTDGWT